MNGFFFRVDNYTRPTAFTQAIRFMFCTSGRIAGLTRIDGSQTQPATKKCLILNIKQEWVISVIVYNQLFMNSRIQVER